jgi:hypothetical protein
MIVRGKLIPAAHKRVCVCKMQGETGNTTEIERTRNTEVKQEEKESQMLCVYVRNCCDHIQDIVMMQQS